MTRLSTLLFPLPAILLLFVLAARLEASPTIAAGLRLVAKTGDRPPGTPAGFTFANFYYGNPVLNNAGQVAFKTFFAPSSSPSDTHPGIWAESEGELKLIAADGVQVPGLPDGIVARIPIAPTFGSEYALNDLGQVAFTAGVSPANDPVAATSGIWIGNGKTLTLVGKNGFPPPANGSEQLAYDTRVTMNRHGNVAFITYSPDWPLYPSYQNILWITDDDLLTAKVVSGVPIGDDSPPIQFEKLRTPLINAVGDVSFFGVERYGSSGIWSISHGVLQPVALAGTIAPGLGGDAHFDFRYSFESGFSALRMNAHGDILFSNKLTGTSVNANNSESLWMWRGGNPELLVRDGDQAPGLTTGVVFHSLESIPALNDSGDVAFRSYLQGVGISARNQSTIWKLHDGVLHAVAQTGMPVPNNAVGDVFDYLEAPMLNGQGRIAFLGEAVGPAQGGYAAQYRGIWAEDAHGQLQLLVRQGQLVDVDPGPGIELKMISDVRAARSGESYVGLNEGNQPQYFNDVGQIAFRVLFEDATDAIFVSSPLNVPEPSTPVLLLIAFISATLAKPTCPSRRP